MPGKVNRSHIQKKGIFSPMIPLTNIYLRKGNGREKYSSLAKSRP